MIDDAEHPPLTDELRVHTKRERVEVDEDRAPVCMACRMGTWTRLVMLAFGLGPIAMSLVALVAAFEGGYRAFLALEPIAWLGYPVLIPFFAGAAILVYVVLVANNRRVSPGTRAAWLAAILLAGPVAIPAYWWAHVWRAPRIGDA